MAFVRVNPGDPIQAQNLDQVIDSLNGVSTKGQPIQLSQLNDATNYALTVQNIEATNSRALNVLKSDGTTLIKADVTGVTLGPPLHIPAGSVGSTELANASVTNAKLASDTARANLLTNGGFENWQRGNGPFTVANTAAADRWLMSMVGSLLSVSRDSPNADANSNYCAAVTYTGGATGASLVQFLVPSDGPNLNGKAVTFSVRVKTTTPNAVRVGLQPGGTPSYGAYHTGGGAYETLTFSAVGGTGQLIAAINFPNTNCTAYLDNAMLVVGSQAADYAPLHPADDLARCLRYYETTPNTNGAHIGAGMCYSTTQALALWAYKAKKALTPTVTVVAPTGFYVYSANASGQPTTALTTDSATTDTCRCVATVAAVLIGGNGTILSTSAIGYLTAEANP